MRLAVFGANGKTGQLLVDAALAAGHQVTAAVRRPEEWTRTAPSLRAVRGDLLEPASLHAAVEGQDAVLSAAGPRQRAPTTLYSQGTANLVAAMRDAGVRRLIVLSAIGVQPGPDLPFPLNLVFSQVVGRVFRESYADGARMETLLQRERGVDWTIIRAPMLNDRPPRGVLRSTVGQRLRHCVRISRADLARFMLDQVGERATLHNWVEVAW